MSLNRKLRFLSTAKMPPVYSKVKVTTSYDGNLSLDFRNCGINCLYFTNVFTTEEADAIFSSLLGAGVLSQHTYQNAFGKTITPHRLTFATVPDRAAYRYNGKDLVALDSELYDSTIDRIKSKIFVPETMHFSDSTICNGYRYNNDDCISPHVDTEKFLQPGNSFYFGESAVYTLTFMADPNKRMEYRLGNPDTSVGYSITPAHGSLIIQGNVLHEVVKCKGDNELGRISLTLRKLREDCAHNDLNCTKVKCSRNIGASNYLYYSNKHSHLL